MDSQLRCSRLNGEVEAPVERGNRPLNSVTRPRRSLNEY